MEKPIDITNDYVFKGIFKDEERIKDFLENILIGDKRILPLDTVIQTIEYLPTEHIQQMLPDLAKKMVFDLQVTTNHGIFIIEMQKGGASEYLKRAEFYSATAYANQQIKRDSSSMKDYTKALPVVTISVIEDKIFAEDVPCVSYHVLLERTTQRQYMKGLSYVFIELGKFNKQELELLMTTQGLQDWLMLLKTQDLNRHYDNEKVNDAVRYIKNIRDNRYDEYIRAQITEVAALKEKEAAKEEGLKEGRKEGYRELAKKLLVRGNALEDIAELTNLSKAEIQELRD